MTARNGEDIPPPAAAGRLDAAWQALQDFLRRESAGGLVLMGAAAAGLVLANSPLARFYTAFLDLPFEIRLGSRGLGKPVILWINDGIMAVFFLLVGMELKREILEGHLSTLRKASLPAFAAAGGMLVPAAIYAAFNRADPAALKGWAIPMATDIAFALGVLSLSGKAVPTAAKAFLLSVAIFDDLGAIVVIALFYTTELSFLSLAIAGGLILALAALNRAGVTRPAAYILVGVPLWVAVLTSGVHATLAGVILAFFIPLRAPEGAESPLRHLEQTLHPWVAFGVVPLFALANAGVPLAGMSPRTAPSDSPRNLRRAGGRQAGRRARALVDRDKGAAGRAAGRHRLEADHGRRNPVRHRVHDEPLHRVARRRAGRRGPRGRGAPVDPCRVARRRPGRVFRGFAPPRAGRREFVRSVATRAAAAASRKGCPVSR